MTIRATLEAALDTVSTLAGANNGTTMIVAPQFLIDFDIAHSAERLPEHGKMLARGILAGGRWAAILIAQAPQKPVSAFTVIDLLLLYLGDKKFFPDLQQVVVAGHGAGGDFVQRYAAVGRATDILARQNVHVRFLVANASSYLYLTSLRPTNGKKLAFAPPDAATCADFNGYAYGLDKPNDYVRRIGANAIKMSLRQSPSPI